jgi:hypothetical protein
MKLTRLALVLLLPGASIPAALAQSSDEARLGVLERRLDTIEHIPPGTTIAQASTSDRIDALERRLDALEKRLGAAPAAAPAAATTARPAGPAQPGGTAAVQLPSGAVQQVPQTTVNAAAAAAPTVPAAQASYRQLGLHKGMTEAEVVKLLGPPVKIRRGTVDVYFYSASSIEPNVNFQYGSVIGWSD